MSNCRCAEILLLSGTNTVRRYVHGHLRTLDDSEQWRALYGCPETGRLWKEHIPCAKSYRVETPELVQITPEAAVREFSRAPEPGAERRTILAAPASGQAYVDTLRRNTTAAGVPMDWNDSRLWRSLRRIGIKREEIEF